MAVEQVVAGKLAVVERQTAVEVAAGKQAAGEQIAAVAGEQTVVETAAGKQAAEAVEVGGELEGHQSDHPDHHHERIPPEQSALQSAGTRGSVGELAAEEQTAAVVGEQIAEVFVEQTAGDSEQTADSAGIAAGTGLAAAV